MPLNSPSFDFKKLVLDQQLHAVQKKLKDRLYPINDLGIILPASGMMHDMENIQPLGVCYMNNLGPEHLGKSVNEINALGYAYYSKYFVKEESYAIFDGIRKCLHVVCFEVVTPV